MSMVTLFEGTSKLLRPGGNEDNLLDVLPKGDQSVVGLYFSAHWCPPCRAFTPKLGEWYNNFKKSSPQRDSFEIVFISSDRDEDSYLEYFKEMPWLALPYQCRELKGRLSKKFEVSGIPTLIFLDGSTGKVLSKDGRSIVNDDPEGKDFPWKPKSFGEIMSGCKLVNKEEKEVKWSEIDDDTIIGMYFSAHWCGPCRGFTPELVKTYNKLQEAGKKFQIIFVSSDREEDSFKEYYEQMPWLALDYGSPAKKKLSARFDVSGIPTLVILRKNGQMITTNGRGAVSQDPDGKEFPWIPKPVNPLNSMTAGTINDYPAIIFFVNSEDVKAVKENIEKVAVPYIKSFDDDRDEGKRVQFLYHTTEEDEDDVGSNFKAFAKINEKENLVLIDIPGQSVYKKEGDHEVKTIQDLLDKYKSKSLGMNPLGI